LVYNRFSVIVLADVPNQAPYFADHIPGHIQLEVDPATDKVWGYTSPSAVDPEGDEVSITLSINSTSDGAILIFVMANNNFGIEVFPNATEGEYALDITLVDTDGATSNYSIILYVSVNVTNLPPYFVEDLPENITFDFTSENDSITNVYTSPQAVDPEDAEVDMGFYLSSSNSFTDAAGVEDHINFTRNADNSFSIEVFDSAPAGLNVGVVTLSDGENTVSWKIIILVIADVPNQAPYF